jgi:hypothetical protein
MSQFLSESFGGYQKARQLFDLVIHDTAEMKRAPSHLKEDHETPRWGDGQFPSTLDTRPRSLD